MNDWQRASLSELWHAAEWEPRANECLLHLPDVPLGDMPGLLHNAILPDTGQLGVGVSLRVGLSSLYFVFLFRLLSVSPIGSHYVALKTIKLRMSARN